MLLAAVMGFIRTRKQPTAWLIDLCVIALALFLMVLVAEYILNAVDLLGPRDTVRIAPQTLLSLVLLTAVAFGRRAEQGFFSLFLGNGMGSKIARAGCPIMLLLPILRELGRAAVIHRHILGPAYSAAVLSSLAALIGCALILFVAWRIDGLEIEVRDLSFRDELTKLYNRRGFYVLAERALILAQRSRAPYSVLFVDLDNLKQVNDNLGHDIGSTFLCEVAELLKKSFREADIIGRIGGDEFAVAGSSTEAGIHQAMQRLEQTVAERNAQPGHHYSLSFSCGHVTSPGDQDASLKSLLDAADAAMYASKRRKNLTRV